MSDDVQEVYVSDAVAAITELYDYLSSPAFRTRSIRDQLERQAHTLSVAHAKADRRVQFQIGSWWPEAAGRSTADIMASTFDLEAALLTIAREYGFESWAVVESLGDTAPDQEFEAAVDATLAGDLEGLRDMLRNAPDLATASSAYGHRATLLHYLGANGVESHRQRVPLNAVEVAGLLIDLGADVMAEANVYGGGQTPFALMVTSAHPAAAGVAGGLAEVLAPPAG